MADEVPDRMLLIVTGSTLRAEEVDRPLAYYLKQQVEDRLESEGLASDEMPPVRVIADFRWLHEEPLQRLPTISLGGPGVNALAQKWLEDLPVSLAVDDQYYIQMDPDLDEPRASIWGMDNPTTQIAASAFVQKFLGRFLARSIETLRELEAEASELVDDDDDEIEDIDPDDD
jgi:hypothetical protein